MTKIIVKPDCNNAPKKEFLVSFNKAFITADKKYILKCIDDNFEWNIVGDHVIKGKEQLTRELDEMITQKIAEINLEKIITHGKEAAVYGLITMENGKKFSFSDMYEFSSAKGTQIKSLTSFVIEI